MVFHKMTAATWAAAAVFGGSLFATHAVAAGPSDACRPVAVEQSTESQIEQVGFRKKVYCPPCNPQPVCPPATESYEVVPPATETITPTPMPTPVDPGDATPVPPAPTPELDTDAAVDNFMNQPAVAQPSAQAPTTSLAQASSNPFASAGGQGFAPGMIGDYFGIGTSAPVFVFGSPVTVPGGGNAPQARIGVQKLAESTSPIPQDRIFFNYSYFSNTSTFGSQDIQRFTPGFEKTFNCGQSSVEVRLPFAATLDANIGIDGDENILNAELGDLTIYFKQILRQTCNLTVSGGLGISLPTSDDVVLNNDVVIASESVHLYPFLGSFWTPNDRVFVTSFAQFDIDVNGNSVYAISTGDTARLQDRNDLFLSTSIGYWMFKDTCRCSDRRVRGVASQLEFHYNQTISGSDAANNGAIVFGPTERIGLLNATLGLTVLTKNDATVTLGYSVPLNSDDQQFDGEARILFTKYLR